MPSRPVVLLQDDDVVAVADAVRRYTIKALGDSDEVEDITQEAVTRLIANRWRIDRRTAPGYAIATARSLIVSRQRESDLAERHQHRLHDPVGTDDPEQSALAAEEESILAASFAVLGERDRSLLLDHHVEGLSTVDLARLRQSSPGATGAALARARGRLRLEYCLQAHRRQVKDLRCRSILTAIAVGDGRRQAALGASRHLPTCDDCRTISAALTSPDRHGAMVGLLGLLAGVAALLRRVLTTHPAAAATTGVATASAVAAAVVLLPHGHAAAVPVSLVAVATPVARSASPAPRHGVISGASDLLELPAATALSSFDGRPVLGRHVPVLAVDADEGFWIGTPRDRLWVQLSTRGESSISVKAGTLIDFAGTVALNPAGYAKSQGVTRAEDAAQLIRERVHIVVPAKDIAVVR